MPEEFVTFQVHNEFAKRIDQENERQNHRIGQLEEQFAMIQTLCVSYEKLAVNVEAMTKELTKQGAKLSDLEKKPAQRWDLVVTTVIAGIIGAIVTLITRGFLP